MATTKTSKTTKTQSKNTTAAPKSVRTTTKKPAVKKTATSEKKKILFVASESTPFIATGGLAEVVGSLSKSLVADGGYDVRVILPLYSDIRKEYTI